jgi:hypothetical protein
VIPHKLPRHVILIRWGTFRLDVVGRFQIIGIVTLVAGLIGLRLFLW